MLGLPIAFAAPLVLVALVLLPLIWWLLRLTPPKAQQEAFPPFRILARLKKPEETPANTPWWLTLLRLLMTACVIFAMAGPIWNPSQIEFSGDGPVLLIIDDGWASGNNWEKQKKKALELVAEADRMDRPVILAFTASAKPEENTLYNAIDAAEVIEGTNNLPLKTDHAAASQRVENLIQEFSPSTAFWLSDGLAEDASIILAEVLAASGTKAAVVTPPDTSAGEDAIYALGRIVNDPEMLKGKIARLQSQAPASVDITAYDKNELPIARSDAVFAPGQGDTEFSIAAPVELRNQITRITIENAMNAGSVKLLDENFRRRLVGLVSGARYDVNQQLLSPLYYIRRALDPYNDLREANDANISTSVPDLVDQGVTSIVLADVGKIDENTETLLTDWIEKGGVLLRFAGPRLAAADVPALLPVELRPGDRDLGGALSWETPKELAAFPATSPFAGLKQPEGVTIRKQVLAFKSLELEKRTWAILEDGTPLVTARQIGRGYVVLFHTNSDNEWSNLPLSGTFVEMLRRTVSLSSTSGLKNDNAQEETRLPPLAVLNGRGELTAPDITIEPLSVASGVIPAPSIVNPPGKYGTSDGYFALNLFQDTPQLKPLAPVIGNAGLEQQGYDGREQVDLIPWLLGAAVLLMLLDCLAVLWIAGALRLPQGIHPSAKNCLAPFVSTQLVLALLASLAFSAYAPAIAHAQEQNGTNQKVDDETIDFSATLITRIAYVKTGIKQLDETSRAGLSGLTRFLASRTSLEPGEPKELDLEVDELNFYPLIYWPIDTSAPVPSTEAMARIDAYMKQGGSILFDTRDQIYSSRGTRDSTPEAHYLQGLLAGLDIPPLEPVPEDHVLTKSFYLLSTFPGRFAGGDLWVEASSKQEGEGRTNRPVRAGDGVSQIMITSNDFAGAWAIDAQSRPLFPTVPPDINQREYAFRSGVNLVMYTLTGNYKADQVHIPALLERLGQ